jgi:hypothetical protein
MYSKGKQIRRLLLALCLGCLGTTVQAADNAGTRTISNVSHLNSQRVLIRSDEAWINPGVCDRDASVVLAASELYSKAVYKEMFAMIMSAHVARREVNIKVNGCLAIGGVSYPVVKQVTVR